jgi:predicted ester cyclase
MSDRSNAAIVRSLIQRFFNDHNPSLAKEYFVPDFKWHGGSVGNYQGVENYASAMAGFFRGFPDAHAVEQELIECGDKVTARFVVDATHQGELWGVQPTGRKIRWDAIMIYRLVDGKVSEQWAAEDWAAILHEMGLVQLPWLK